jgi:hypothetical protein
MRTDPSTAPVDDGEQAGAYEAPKVVVLGTFAELTQQGNTPVDELLNDGSQI